MVSANRGTELAAMVNRIIAGDRHAEEELVCRYRDGVSVIIGQIVQSWSVTEDIFQETFRISLQKIRRGDVREPERLSGFICGVARNLALDHVRNARRSANQEEIGVAEQLPDPVPNQLEVLCERERINEIRQLISELKVKRDREVLLRYFIAEEDKDHICASLSLTRIQLNGVLSRALGRYKELYLRREGGPERVAQNIL